MPWVAHLTLRATQQSDPTLAPATSRWKIVIVLEVAKVAALAVGAGALLAM
jgi:hypothetical protein